MIVRNGPGILFRLSPQAEIDLEALQGEYDPASPVAYFDNQPLTPPAVEEAFPPDTRQTTLGAAEVLSTAGQKKRIEVDLTNQRLYAYEGDQKVYDFLISSGKWGRTPTGLFHVWVKLRYSRMAGGSKALHTYYNLPNVPYVMYFYNEDYPKPRGFGIHGTYWHDNFGHPMSHGCLNLRTADAESLYYWAEPDLQGKPSIPATTDNPGTEIIIYGTAPST